MKKIYLDNGGHWIERGESRGYLGKLRGIEWENKKEGWHRVKGGGALGWGGRLRIKSSYLFYSFFKFGLNCLCTTVHTQANMVWQEHWLVVLFYKIRNLMKLMTCHTACQAIFSDVLYFFLLFYIWFHSRVLSLLFFRLNHACTYS